MATPKNDPNETRPLRDPDAETRPVRPDPDPARTVPTWAPPVNGGNGWGQHAGPSRDAPTWDGPSSGAPAWGAPASDAPTWDAPDSDAPTWGAPASDAPTWGGATSPGAQHAASGEVPGDRPAWTSTAVGGASPSGGVPGWGGPPPGSGVAPRPRRGAGRALAATIAALLLVLTGVGLTLLVDRRDSSAGVPAGAGVPVAAQPAPLPAGEEPVAAVARTLGPSVVQIETDQGLGSGVIYDRNGQVLGIDQGNDIAVVKVDRGGLKPAALALGVDVQVGQTAVAIGSPFGLQQTVTAGVVSAKNRSLATGNGGALEVIQTDAPINPGNSGGALADRSGRVIGINDSIRSESGGNEGVGFAIPIDTAASSASRIVKGEKIQSGYLGVSLSTPTLGRGGALIDQVLPGSPAEKAGIQVGDLVIEFNGKAIQSSDDLAAQVRLAAPGQKVGVKLVRGGKEQTVTAALTERPIR